MKIIKEGQENAISLAIEFLRCGKIIAFATDTIYGLAVDASNLRAVEALYQIKNRNSQKPIAIFVKDLAAAKEIFYFEPLAEKIAEKFLPGPLTMVLETKPEARLKLSSNLNNNDNFLGFRIVNQKFIQDLLYKFNGILAVTSANISDKKSATSANEVLSFFQNSDILIIDGDLNGMQKIASTVIKIFHQKLEILRHGAIDEDQLKNL